MIAKCACDHCGKNIEFATEEFLSGSSIACPHCGKETFLSVSSKSKPAAPKNFIPDKKPEPKTSATIQPSNDSRFNTALQLLQLAALICIAGFMYYDWHQKQLVTNNRLIESPVPNWEYESFEWHGLQFDNDHPNQVRATFLHRNSDKNISVLKDGIEASDLTILLNSIGIEGWELVSYDGTRYIVKRPYNQNSVHDFSVESHWEQLKQ